MFSRKLIFRLSQETSCDTQGSSWNNQGGGVTAVNQGRGRQLNFADHQLNCLLQCIINPLRPNNDLSQTSHCNIKGLSVSEVLRIENMITQVKFY